MSGSGEKPRGEKGGSGGDRGGGSEGGGGGQPSARGKAGKLKKMKVR